MSPRGSQNEPQTAPPRGPPDVLKRASSSTGELQHGPREPPRGPLEDPYMVGEGPPRAPRRAQVPLTGEEGPRTVELGS
eukprot:973936-Pyramimonas_sp.AAC.1